MILKIRYVPLNGTIYTFQEGSHLNIFQRLNVLIMGLKIVQVMIASRTRIPFVDSVMTEKVVYFVDFNTTSYNHSRRAMDAMFPNSLVFNRDFFLTKWNL